MPYALALTVVLAALAIFQLALVFGAPLGHFAWGGQHRVQAAHMLRKLGVTPLPEAFPLAWTGEEIDE